jgi:predicted enzyme related to lactoylglutathione lyase
VEDIEATLKTVESLGGAVVRPKETIPGMGSFAYFKDTEGNVMGLWENLPADQQAQAAG